eukprot:TRINITY_DN20727_c0_g1_i1.p1 TRINITY_DN20727_c0_g1~~TRINITY_DN20727_c0_g1_i1.p1  ORF type:complete len:157 (-),score=16.42 TRINITY_DN20727_c0_g1_i1:869-1339(-)
MPTDWRTARQLLTLKRIGGIHHVTPNSTVFQALETMCRANVGAVLVLDEGSAKSKGKIVGILSERDYARKVVLAGRSSSNTKVEEIMTKEVVTASPSASATSCMNVVLTRHIRHLPVVDEDGAVQGVLSIGDLLREVVEHQAELIAQMTNFIEQAQ